jgi:hypothetical protein
MWLFYLWLLCYRTSKTAEIDIIVFDIDDFANFDKAAIVQHHSTSDFIFWLKSKWERQSRKAYKSVFNLHPVTRSESQECAMCCYVVTNSISIWMLIIEFYCFIMCRFLPPCARFIYLKFSTCSYSNMSNENHAFAAVSTCSCTSLRCTSFPRASRAEYFASADINCYEYNFPY